MNAVLVMNRGWSPIEMWHPHRAVRSVYAGKAKAVDRDYRMYGWDEWTAEWSDPDKIARSEFRTLKSPNMVVAMPEVIVLTEFEGYVNRRIRLTPRNVFLRDGGMCQYCGAGKDDGRGVSFNVDHVVPRGTGGQTRWKNVVLACEPCNTAKGCRTPEQAGMKLRREPFVPKWYHLKGAEFFRTMRAWGHLLGMKDEN